MRNTAPPATCSVPSATLGGAAQGACGLRPAACGLRPAAWGRRRGSPHRTREKPVSPALAARGGPGVSRGVYLFPDILADAPDPKLVENVFFFSRARGK
eukprot:gene10363-biopygen9333